MDNIELEMVLSSSKILSSSFYDKYFKESAFTGLRLIVYVQVHTIRNTLWYQAYFCNREIQNIIASRPLTSQS